MDHDTHLNMSIKAVIFCLYVAIYNMLMYDCEDLLNFIIADLRHMSNSDLTNLASNHNGIIPNHSLIYYALCSC